MDDVTPFPPPFPSLLSEFTQNPNNKSNEESKKERMRRFESRKSEMSKDMVAIECPKQLHKET